MPDAELAGIVVRPIGAGERSRFDAELDEHHWLGHRLVGETMRYVAVDGDGRWLAVVGFGAAALSCKPRDVFIGWSAEQQFRRLRYVVNNQRFCVLPAGRRSNVASRVLSQTLRRLSADYETRWGHPVLVVETFVDPSRHRGTCYQASGFSLLGETLGYGRRGGRYVHHGNTKLSFARVLRRDARRVLAASFDHPALAHPGGLMLDLDAFAFDGDDGLVARLTQVADDRKRRGVRHNQAAVLALAVAATLAGARSVAAIGEYAADCPQDVLRRLGAKFHPVRRRYIAPHADTFRRALARVDADQLDATVGAWLLDQVHAGRVSEERLVIALDGKSLRGSLGDDGRAVHLFAAMVHGEGVLIGQTQVEAKSNEIDAFKPLLEPLDLAGALVTADAMHTQREHARWLIEHKHADYLFQVKANQPKLLAAIEAIDDDQLGPAHDHTTRGHGRTEHRSVRVAPIPAEVTFPYAAQVVVVYRERADLDDRMLSADTSYYITSIPADRADADSLGQHVRGHWEIENKVHWVRDWAFDEDRHQLRAAASPAHALATLRNVAISLLRLAGATNIAKALRWVARDATRAATLLGC